VSTPLLSVDREALNDFLLQLLAVRSHSLEEGEIAKVLRSQLERFGFTVEVDDAGNVTGTLELGPGPTILLDSHLDTVVVTDPAAWAHNPAGELADGRIYGRGAVDMKGPLAACVFGVAALRDSLRVGRIIVAGTVAEELAEGPSLVRVAEQAQPDYVVICEATSRRVAIGQRGRAEILVEVTGKSAHSAHPAVGVNAADVMADVITALRRAPAPQHPVLGPGILVLTDVVSRPYPGLSVIPDQCLATFDRRTLPGETDQDVLAPVRSIVNRVAAERGATASVSIAVDRYTTYTGVQVEAPNFAPAWYLGDSPLVDTVLSALAAQGMPAQRGHYAFCTNGSGTAGHLGIPTIGFGPGDEDQAHSVDESIATDDLYAGALGYAAIVTAIATQPAGR